MNKGVIIDSNERKINQFTKVVMHTVDRVVTSNPDGILKKPTSSAELSSFNETVKEVVMNKVRNRLGV